MKLQVTVETSSLEITQARSYILEVADFGLQRNAVDKRDFDAAGDLLVGTGDGTYTRKPRGLPLQVLVPDEDDPDSDGTKLTWITLETGGGSAQLTNKDGEAAPLGGVVRVDADADSAFQGTTYYRDRRVAGVAGEVIEQDDEGKVLVGPQRALVLVQGNVARGQWLVASTTKWRAQAEGYAKPAGAIGIALTEYTGGGAGSVQALLSVDHHLGAAGGTVWGLGGERAGNAIVTHALKLPQATEVWSVVAGAALTVARTHATGAQQPALKGFMLGGHNSVVTTADRLTFATETTAAVASANLSSARGRAGGGSGATTAFAGGGDTNAASVTTTDRLTFSTETTAAVGAAAFGEAHAGRAGVEDGAAAIFGGGGDGTTASANLRKIPFATETRANLAGTLATSRTNGAGVSDATIGYFIGGRSGATAQAATDRMPFSTETPATHGPAGLGTARSCWGSVQTMLTAYFPGGQDTYTLTTDRGDTSGSPLSLTEKMPFSTETTAVLSGGALPAATMSQSPVWSEV